MGLLSFFTPVILNKQGQENLPLKGSTGKID